MRAKPLVVPFLVVLGGVLANGCGQQRPPFGFEELGPKTADVADAGAGAEPDAFLGQNPGDLGTPIDSGGACATATVELARTAIYMEIILDGSGSMLDPIVAGGPTGRKWAAASDALVSFFEDLGKKNDPAFAVGLFLFDGTKDVHGFTVADVPIHQVDAKHLAALKGRIRGSMPKGGTPIKRSLEGQLPILTSFVPPSSLTPNGKRVLVIITDGVPDGASDIQPMVQSQCATMLEDAFKGTPKVSTFAIGVGDPTSDPSTYDEVFMGKLAVAGGAPAASCTPGWNEASPAGQIPCHIQITPGQKTPAQLRDEFIAAIDTVRGAASRCEFTLERSGGAGEVLDPTKVNVVITAGNGTESTVPQNAMDGWTYDDPKDPTKVMFNGAACESVKGGAGKVSIVLGCQTIVK